jgi:riboflavin synthase
MFTGIVEKTLAVTAVSDHNGSRRLVVSADWPGVKLGQSIAIIGCCLTVAHIENGQIAFDVIAETLDKTNLGRLKSGDSINAERSLKAGDPIDGHFVQGHVDGRAKLKTVKSDAQESRLTLQAPENLAKYLVPKGSVTIDGVSLTIAAVNGDEFQVALIPTTLQLTTLGDKKPGWEFNLECDVLSKTIVYWLEQQTKSVRKT